MCWSHVQNIGTSVMVSTMREFLIMGKHSGRFWPARGNNAKKIRLANTLLLYIYSSPLFSFSTPHLFFTHILFPFTNQQFPLFYCDTEKSSNKIVPPMPRGGGCRRMLENTFFDRDPRGVYAVPVVHVWLVILPTPYLSQILQFIILIIYIIGETKYSKA